MKGSYILALTLSLSIISPACSDIFMGTKEKEEFRKTCNLDAHGSVSLNNINGSVEIRVWDEPRVEIKAVKSGPTAEKLKLVNIEVKEGADRVEIDTVYPKDEKNLNVSVTYELTVPRNASLGKVETVNGSIDISGVQGRIDTGSTNGSIIIEDGGGAGVKAGTTNGSVKASLQRQPESVSLESTNGSITLSLPDAINAQVEASTTNGRINNDFTLSSQETGDSKHLKGKMGTGGAQFTLETVNGSININRKK
jgi:DUF4097 and DUF4098 domain-containing protein YvlB